MRDDKEAEGMRSIAASIFAAGFSLKDRYTEEEVEAQLEEFLQQGETPTPSCVQKKT